MWWYQHGAPAHPLLTLVLLRLRNANGNVLVLFTVMESNLDQIPLNVEEIHRRVLHGPCPLLSPFCQDHVNFFVGGMTWAMCTRRARDGFVSYYHGRIRSVGIIIIITGIQYLQ